MRTPKLAPGPVAGVIRAVAAPQRGPQAANGAQPHQNQPENQNPRQTPLKPTRPISPAPHSSRPAAPDRPSERSERDVRAASGRAVAVAGAGAVAALGKNTSNVSPLVKSARANRYRLRRSLRLVNPARQAKCGHCTIGRAVAVGVKQGRARFTGLLRCGSVWLCPVCAATIKSVRAQEVTHLYKWHMASGGSVLMLTLTVRHAIGHDLRMLRKGVAHAWRLMQSGKQWQAMKHQLKLTGTVRALEVTHGKKHGYHPHLHVLLLLPQMAPDAIAALRARLSVRWQSAVGRAIGEDFVGNDKNGCDLRPAHEADYITKLGLEISDVGTKAGRGGNRSPWEVAADFAATGDCDDGDIWQQYAKGIKGARMLTWSRGLRAAAGLGVEATDDEIVEGEEADVPDRFVMSTVQWREIRDGDVWKLLDAVESDDNARILAVFRELRQDADRRRQRRE